MRQIFRRNTSPAPSPREDSQVIGFGIPNTVEKLKKGPGFKFRERDRIKVIAPQEFKYRTGHIVEAHDLQNDQGLMEIELDHQLNDTDGFEKLSDVNLPRARLTIKNPNQQLRPYRYMKCNAQHFETTLKAEALSQITNIATYLLGFELISFVFALKNGSTDWHHYELFISYVIFSSISIGLGFFIVTMLSFIISSIKRISAQNNLIQNGSIHDECRSYHWLKSTHWKPWWLCGREDVGCIEFVCQKTVKSMAVFIATFIIAIVIYITDQTEWYLGMLCLALIATPSLLALHVIRKRDMMAF